MNSSWAISNAIAISFLNVAKLRQFKSLQNLEIVAGDVKHSSARSLIEILGICSRCVSIVFAIL